MKTGKKASCDLWKLYFVNKKHFSCPYYIIVSFTPAFNFASLSIVPQFVSFAFVCFFHGSLTTYFFSFMLSIYVTYPQERKLLDQTFPFFFNPFFHIILLLFFRSSISPLFSLTETQEHTKKNIAKVSNSRKGFETLAVVRSPTGRFEFTPRDEFE